MLGRRAASAGESAALGTARRGASAPASQETEQAQRVQVPSIEVSKWFWDQ